MKVKAKPHGHAVQHSITHKQDDLEAHHQRQTRHGCWAGQAQCCLPLSAPSETAPVRCPGARARPLSQPEAVQCLCQQLESAAPQVQGQGWRLRLHEFLEVSLRQFSIRHFSF